ncbi:MAG TPA: GDSL-type esterase/lipase family protein [Terriglobales bacterium]|jgi:lysophospholipase L1-like esterase|nr:GDSL-type esterase/lipase family protein [Terriglobales bacterium]
MASYMHKYRAYIMAFCFAVAPGKAHAQTHWVGSWAASQQLAEPQNSLPANDLRDATLRQIVHLSIGGPTLRVKISNRYGAAPLHFTGVHIARPESSVSAKIVSGTDKALSFSGVPDVIVPAGADYISDPVAFPVTPLSDLAITLHIDAPPAQQTGHPGSRATSYVVHGDRLSALDLADAKKFEHWYFIAGVDLSATSQASAVVTLGDSITDGHGATTNGNDRWPDVLAKRLQAQADTRNVAVLNHGIGGNRLLLDGLGPNALARFDHDVLAQAGVRYAIVLEGVNDLGMLTKDGPVSRAEQQQEVHRVTDAYAQIVTRAHAHGIRVFAATITPFVGSAFYHPGPDTEADRQEVNEWIRTPGHFDAVIDFDQLVRDPAHPDRLLPKYDSGDHLHPSPEGYAAMAEAIPLSLFVSASSPQIAFTFDDLPAHGTLPPGETRMEVASKIITAMRNAHMPPVYGFVNGADTEKFPGDINVLNAWHAAGNPLGNHSWSHMNPNQKAAEEFETDVLRNEPLLESIMDEADWHWFRYPFLAEGETPEKRQAIRTFLGSHGYRIAAVTMSFGDYRWTEPYARCKAKGDNAAVATLKETYLEAADKNIDFYRELSHKVLGRDVPYVLLMHIGALDAEMLPQLLELYRSRGFQFITLEQAERDEFYRVSTNLRLPAAPDMLEGLAAERHIQFPPQPQLSVEPESMCK